VQTAGDLVGILVELAAGVQDRHDDFKRRLALELGVFDVVLGVHRMPRPSSTTVAEPSAWMVTSIVLAKPARTFVDRVVDHFVDE